MKDNTEINSYEIIERMKKISNVFQDKELAEVLGLTAASIVSWKKRNTIPLENLIKISNLFNTSVDFLLWGKEQQSLSTHEKMALLAFNDLNERQKLNAIAYMTGLHQESGKQPAIVQTANGDNNNLAAEIKNK